LLNIFNRNALEKKIGAMTLARSISIVAALVVAMVLTRILNQDYYGAYRKLWLLYMLLGPSFISAAVGTLYYRGGIREKKSIVIHSSILLSLIFSTVIFITSFAGASVFAHIFNAPGLSKSIRGFSLYMFFSTFAGLSEPIFVIINRKKWLLVYNLTYNILESLLIIIPFYMGIRLETIVLIMSIGPFLRTVFIIGITYWYTKEWPAWNEIKSEFRKSFNYSLGLFVVALAGIASVQIDKWVVGNYFSNDMMFAIYSVGARKIPFISALTASITSSLIVHYSSKLEHNDFRDMLKAARKTTDQLFLFLIPALALFFIYSKEIMVILFQKYAASAPIFQIYLIIIISQFFFAQSVVLGKGLSRINAWIGGLEVLINLVLSIILVRTMGLIGPAIATLIAHFVFQFLMMGYCYRAFHISIREFLPTKKIWPLLLSTPLVIMISLEMKNIIVNSLISFVISGIIAGIILLIQYRFMSINRFSKISR